jgi:anti-sigma-K factor RskA
MATTEHDALRDQIELYVLGALAPDERNAFEAHLASCAECAAHVRELSPVAQLLAYVPPQHEPAAALRARVQASIGALPRAAPAAVASTSRAAVPWLAAAASLMLAAALGVYALSLRSRIGALELRLQEAAERAAAGERQVADLRRATAEVRSQVAVLTAPDVQRIDLAGQAAAPQSSAHAFWSRSRGLVFTAANLPSTPAGKTYQLWVLTKQPNPISAGVFKPDREGRVAATFETPIDLPQPVGMAVTVESEGGVPSPSGEKYLVGM